MTRCKNPIHVVHEFLKLGYLEVVPADEINKSDSFRTLVYALSADISKMYRQVALSSDAKDFHRILWRDSRGQSSQDSRSIWYNVTILLFHSKSA